MSGLVHIQFLASENFEHFAIEDTVMRHSCVFYTSFTFNINIY